MPALQATVYHNTQCSKSNAALNLLMEHGAQVSIVDYLQVPLSSGQLHVLINQLGIEARALIRFSEPIAKELAITFEDNRSENEWLSIMAEHPVLIERPIIVINGKALIGRPPERVLELL